MDEDLSINKIAENLGRSSRVPHKYIHQHNSKVEGAGFCPVCRRVRSELDKTLARRLKSAKQFKNKPINHYFSKFYK